MRVWHAIEGIKRRISGAEGTALHDEVYRTALDLDGDEETVRAAIATAEKRGKATPAELDVWHIAALDESTPLVAQLSEISNGYRLAVTQPIILDGSPIKSQAWSNFRDGVATAAASQGVTTRLFEIAA